MVKILIVFLALLALGYWAGDVQLAEPVPEYSAPVSAKAALPNIEPKINAVPLVSLPKPNLVGKMSTSLSGDSTTSLNPDRPRRNRSYESSRRPAPQPSAFSDTWSPYMDDDDSPQPTEKPSLAPDVAGPTFNVEDLDFPSEVADRIYEKYSGISGGNDTTNTNEGEEDAPSTAIETDRSTSRFALASTSTSETPVVGSDPYNSEELNAEEEMPETLGPFSYRIYAFKPGKRKDGVPIRERPISLGSLLSNIAGPPDWDLDKLLSPVDARNEALKRLLTLGNNGVLILEIVDGVVVDGEGVDFVIFENVFVKKVPDALDTEERLSLNIEPAFVSVSEDDPAGPFVSFPCDGGKSWDDMEATWKGCAGRTPVFYAPGTPLDQAGGDGFDLARIGLTQARYIRIQDSGLFGRFALMRGQEGADLDSIALIHTERTQPAGGTL